jgi:hypothetical protein
MLSTAIVGLLPNNENIMKLVNRPAFFWSSKIVEVEIPIIFPREDSFKF